MCSLLWHLASWCLKLPEYWLFAQQLFRVNKRKHQRYKLSTLCEGNPVVTSGFPSQTASNSEAFPCHHIIMHYLKMLQSAHLLLCFPSVHPQMTISNCPCWWSQLLSASTIKYVEMDSAVTLMRTHRKVTKTLSNNSHKVSMWVIE